MKHVEEEIVVYVGIAVHDRAFSGLPPKDRDFIARLTGVGDAGFRPILRHGEIVGYGIPIVIADAKHEFDEVDFDQLHTRLAKARAQFTNMVRRVAKPFEAKCYAPKLFHHPVQASA